ncbi:MAG TPA: LptA/OstA family protein [Terracidiphilus sp.]|nr:LptA/OstA family protein [Terracidiphilus sp.]
MRFTIERLRTLVLGAGVLLVVALVVFLAVGKWKNPLNLKELPKRLGVNIQQEANGVTFSHALGAHSQFKIHASKVVQLKNDHALLHDVKIELYGEDGSRVDRIEGAEFEYNQKDETATAAGPVEITLMRPGVAPAIAPNVTPSQVVSDKAIAKPLATAAETAASGEIHVKTSGLTFSQKSGVATTSQRVDFSVTQGSGSSMGATYDSQQGTLALDHAVELTTRRGSDTVEIHAQHAEFRRDDLECHLKAARADFRGGQAMASEAKILFRGDGSAIRLDATTGLTLTTAAGGHLGAPTGSMDFDDHNQPRHGHLEGGVQMDSVNGDRQIHGTSPAADLEFTTKGELRHAHLERGVEIHSEEVRNPPANSQAAVQRLSRTWRSPVVDVDFRDEGHGKVEPATIHGLGGVVISGVSQRGKAAPVPSRLSADEVSGDFGPDSALSAMTGVGHAGIEETTASGDTQTASGDRLEAHFDAHFPAGANPAAGAKRGLGGAAQIQSAVLDGHVVLIDQPAAKPSARAEAPLRAVAGRAVYEGTGEWLHLTQSPRVEDGAMQLTADKIDVSQDSGDALAHGNVKATWADTGKNGTGQPANGPAGSMSLGGQGPVHAVAQEAQIHRASEEATFRGHARLWQQANSIAGPVVVLDRPKKSLVSRSTDPAEPVRVVLLSAESLEPGLASGKDAGGKVAAPSVIRVRGGELDYSDIERKAVMIGGALGTVVAETGSATSTSNQVELFLVPAGSRAVKETGQGQVDMMTASGHVVVSSQGRRGTGEQLTYASKAGEYVLTGTTATPPRINDPVRGIVTGEALIFHSRDDSVSIEGGGHETRTETVVRQGDGKSEPRR